MKRLFLLALVASMAGCDDGVPAVADPHHIVVDGKPMTQAEFLNAYCSNAPTNPTCIAVSKALRADATKGAQPKGW
jgi:hypothetical protein